MKLMIKEVAQAKGFKKAKHLPLAMSEHFGVQISFSTIYPLWDDTAQLWSRQTVDRLCEFLQVPAGLLIQHIPGEAQQQPPQAGQSEDTQARAAKVESRAATSKRKRDRGKSRGARAGARV